MYSKGRVMLVSVAHNISHSLYHWPAAAVTALLPVDFTLAVLSPKPLSWVVILCFVVITVKM